MTSLVLRIALRFLQPLLLVASLFFMLRGHNDPGGGFPGGLLAAGALSLHAVAEGVPSARRVLRVSPHVMIGAGWGLAVSSGAFAFAAGQPYMTSQAIDVLGVHLSTVLMFELGVYVLVFGAVVLIVFTLLEEP